jgi:hypothetical protein
VIAHQQGLRTSTRGPAGHPADGYIARSVPTPSRAPRKFFNPLNKKQIYF